MLSLSAGVLFFSFKFPERFFPNKFDVFFHSHQVRMHCVICV